MSSSWSLPTRTVPWTASSITVSPSRGARRRMAKGASGRWCSQKAASSWFRRPLRSSGPSKTGGVADQAVGAVQRTAQDLIPFRGWVRKLSGAERYSKKVAAAKWIPSRSELLKDEFVAVDFETANRLSGASACQVALVKVAGGEVVDQMCTYLRPPEEYIRFEFSHIHGIDRGDVEDAPSWFDIADHIAQVTLIGPGKGNAMGPAFWAEMPDVFGTLDADPDARQDWAAALTFPGLLNLLVLAFVLVVELLNSAIEAVVDRISLERHPLSRNAKDLGSAAVFVSVIVAGLTWAAIVVPVVLR